MQNDRRKAFAGFSMRIGFSMMRFLNLIHPRRVDSTMDVTPQ
jgi:hypothetical protein